MTVLLTTIGFWLVVFEQEAEIVRVTFGEDYVRFVGLYSLLLLAVLPQATLKLFGVYCNACGRPWIAAVVEGGRAVFIALAVVWMGSTLKAAALAWVVGEFASLGLCGLMYWLVTERGGVRA